ncbi:MAG: hypothetical protein VW644_10005, partial [Alphaproteobacteria bacterium]
VELEMTLQARGRVEALANLRAWMPEPGQIAYVRQQEPLGLGHAVWCARELVGDEPESGMLYRLDCVAWTAGAIAYRLSR